MSSNGKRFAHAKDKPASESKEDKATTVSKNIQVSNESTDQMEKADEVVTIANDAMPEPSLPKKHFEVKTILAKPINLNQIIQQEQMSMGYTP